MKKLVGRMEEPDGSGGWRRVPDFQLYSTDSLPIVGVTDYPSHAEAAHAAGSNLVFVQSPEQATQLWSPQPETLDLSARKGLEQRRARSVERAVTYAINPSGSHYIRKVILCDANGDLPPDLQPTCSVLVLREGDPTAIDTVSSDEFGAAIARHLNQLENEAARADPEQIDDTQQAPGPNAQRTIGPK